MSETTSSHRAAGYDEGPPSGWAPGFIIFAGGDDDPRRRRSRPSPAWSRSSRTSSTSPPATTCSSSTPPAGAGSTCCSGLLVLFAGFAVMSGKTWGRVVGHHPGRAQRGWPTSPSSRTTRSGRMTIIALDVFVIWALAAHGRDITR